MRYSWRCPRQCDERERRRETTFMSCIRDQSRSTRRSVTTPPLSSIFCLKSDSALDVAAKWIIKSARSLSFRLMWLKSSARGRQECSHV